jgi:hypothetical protein
MQCVFIVTEAARTLQAKSIFALAVLAGLILYAGTAVAAPKDYGLICGSVRLPMSDRNECRKQMDAATTDAERAKIYRLYDLKIAGFNPDGTRIKK